MTFDRQHSVIPISTASPFPAAFVPTTPIPTTGQLIDTRKRRLHDLRISVTDRCNFRCTYCMPKSVFNKDYQFLPQQALLSFEEIERLAKIFTAHGVEKIRLTGGEPLLRKNLEQLLERLAAIRTNAGKPLDLTLTTNASLLTRKAKALKDAGLHRLTVSLDALDDARFRAMNDVDFPVAAVLAGIEAAQKAGFQDIKINMVVKRGVNEDQIIPMARYFRDTGLVLRFIEFMDVGSSNGWKLDDVVPRAQIVDQLNQVFGIEPLEANYPGEVAARWRYRDGRGEIGIISSVTQTFCHECTRLRLSTEGQVFTCLFATEGHDLRALLRGGSSDEEIASAIAYLWQQRTDRYSELRSAQTPELKAARPKIEMSYIGG